MVDPTNTAEGWHPWRVAPTSGFEVRDPAGEVGLLQIDPKQFLVEKPFRFSDDAVLKMLTDSLVAGGKTVDEAHVAVEDARTFSTAVENPTDLASIPRFMRWFESSYGAHTLAAILHDNLIVDTPNAGALGSDTLSDRFFREMMGRAGVPWLKRWIMWAAVALRSRWAAGGIRRTSVVVWLVLASAGIAAFVWAAGSAVFGWSHPGSAWILVFLAVVLPFAAAFLWGRQYGAGLVAATAAIWILPAAVLAGVGYLVYMALEALARRFGLH